MGRAECRRKTHCCNSSHMLVVTGQADWVASLAVVHTEIKHRIGRRKRIFSSSGAHFPAGQRLKPGTDVGHGLSVEGGAGVSRLNSGAPRYGNPRDGFLNQKNVLKECWLKAFRTTGLKAVGRMEN